jgi:hypothetical protein
VCPLDRDRRDRALPFWHAITREARAGECYGKE